MVRPSKQTTTDSFFLFNIVISAEPMLSTWVRGSGLSNVLLPSQTPLDCLDVNLILFYVYILSPLLTSLPFITSPQPTIYIGLTGDHFHHCQTWVYLQGLWDDRRGQIRVRMGDGYGGKNITRCEDKLGGETGASSECKGNEQRLCVPCHQQNLTSSPTDQCRFLCPLHWTQCTYICFLFICSTYTPPQVLISAEHCWSVLISSDQFPISSEQIYLFSSDQRWVVLFRTVQHWSELISAEQSF
jgi:hypothetical protein